MKRTIATILMIILAIAFTLTIVLRNSAAVGVEIVSITPLNHHGKIGETVRVIGTINTTNGLYQIWFNISKVVEANATANIVNATFTVPQKLPRGNYTITLTDYSLNGNSTTWFYIETAYYVEAKTPVSPIQLQEGNTVEIWVNVTGGESKKAYSANVTVKIPAPLNTTYWTLATLTNTTDTGEGYNITTVYPTHFGGALYTNHVGTYTVAFNKTLATDTFAIGLTNSTEYHRYEIVDIKAVEYKPSENVTVKIDSAGKMLLSHNVTATTEGLITANWTVPSNASIGTYTINVTSISLNATVKSTPDVQRFTVPGFNVNATTKSLAGEIISNVGLRVFENAKSIANLTSTSNGLLQMKLEVGNYSSTAFYKSEKVGEFTINVTASASLNLYCNLTNLRISVLTKLGSVEVPIPDTKIYLTPQNQTLYTNNTGATIAHLLPPNHTYTLNSSRYGISFNVTSISTLLTNGNAVAWYNVTLICPTLTLQIDTTKPNNEPIGNVKVSAEEFMGGLFYEGNTNPEGIIIFNSTFGKYIIKVFDADGIKLNETTVNLFVNQNASLVCSLYGLAISFRVADYFGQPILNANVTLRQEDTALRYTITQANGIATFNNVTGGSLQVSVHVFNQMQPDVTKDVNVENSTTIEIKLEEYVLLGGILVNTAILAMIIIIAATVVPLLIIEIYRRRRSKPLKSSKKEQE